MACCTIRSLLIGLCTLQLVSTVVRQVFDFLGFMWGTIIVNFLHIVLAIVGLFGAVQYRPRVVLVYLIWNIVFLAVNVVIVLLYLQPDVKIGLLSSLRAVSILSINVRDQSWWVTSGLSCDDQTCVLRYNYIEIIQAGLQCVLSLLSIAVAACVMYSFRDDEDSTMAVNDELEFIKMRYKSPSSRAGAYTMDGPPYNALPPPSNYNTLNTTVASQLGTGDAYMYGRSMERRRSEKSERQSVKDGNQDLPWVSVGPAEYPQTNIRNSMDPASVRSSYVDAPVLRDTPMNVQAMRGSHMEIQGMRGSHTDVQGLRGSHTDVQGLRGSHADVHGVRHSHVEDEVGPPGYYQVMEQRQRNRRSNSHWRDQDAVLI